MQAFILAAGLGTRLKPITDNRPKALVEVQGITLLQHTIDNLKRQGISHIVVNVHHHAAMVKEFILNHSWGIPVVISDESDLLLDTGGGLKKAAPLFLENEPILIHNVDILSRTNFAELLNHHTDSMSLATLVTSQRKTSRYLLFHNQQLMGWNNQKTDEFLWVNDRVDIYQELAFDGIALIEPHLIDLLPAADHPYSIIPAYLKIAKKHRISYFEIPQEDWIDVGKHETLNQAQQWKLS
ncbi:MAG: nucleotidyltransferase family protein [Bacteroidales bacterium]|nr:nucleotidyltransferase family protein [Candidatus Colimorpha merdihippi]